VKRGLDVAGSGVGLLFLAPLLAVIAVAIKVDSPGPVLFRQKRIGRGTRPFWMFKFRTMIDGADEHKAQLLHRNERPGRLVRARLAEGPLGAADLRRWNE
jgi:lipopolysaccharide/colanic/teichoic acid biosynthesis glycosyltransferase